MTPFVSAILAGLLVAGIAFVGFGSLLIAKNLLERLLLGIVAFAAGGLLGGAFFHLLPESLEMNEQALTYALIGLITFFVLDSLLWVYHCHGGHRLHDEHKHHHASCPPEKPVGWLNLAGDAIHNLTDGVVIASAFLVNPALGWSATLAVALHEVPQEIGDFGILIHSGFNRRKALLLNGLVALTVLVGIIGVFIAQEYVAGLTAYTLPFAAGGFIYMACTNLLSEIKEEESIKRRAVQFVFFLLGLGLLWITRES
ncbi:ZIP family metal transporter [Candidatus Uhrbacteria bacterium]|nr:ZIP family metal transporter [Candidatus Uhrbacteria bacterium]